MPRTGQPAARHVAAVERALAVVDALADGGEELGTNELARRTGINASTVSRLLATLAAAGIVEHVAATGRYRLGLRLLQLGNTVLARLDLRDLARPHLQALVDATGETATLSAPGGRDAVTVDFVQSASSVQSVARVGRPSIGHATATGKVLLAFGSVSLPRGPLAALTDRTIVDRAVLAEELERVRRRGYASALGEREPDLNAIAAPVLDGAGELAAIMGVQGPSSRFGDERMRQALPQLLRRAGAVSQALGWREPHEAVRALGDRPGGAPVAPG
ncbi:MAG TPA: IclR family transcriptional regulator [Gaiellaceae bacterium]|nr:IclR family transcriptional regulator [Gaiellaceae bacterium]